MGKNKREKLVALLQEMAANPQSDLEEEYAAALGNYVSTVQGVLMSSMFSSFFGSDADLSDNMFVSYLVDYMELPGKKTTEKQVEILEEEYDLLTAEGCAKFNADSLSVKEAGDEALITEISNRRGHRLTQKDMPKLQEAVEASKQYTEGAPAFLSENDSREELCRKFIAFEAELQKQMAKKEEKGLNQ